MKHTPGPWELQTLDNRFHGYDWQTFCIRSPQNVCLAVVGDVDRYHSEDIPYNARLIAAAPDGFALAEHILAMADDAYLVGHPEWLEIVKEAQAFKARAEGREESAKETEYQKALRTGIKPAIWPPIVMTPQDLQHFRSTVGIKTSLDVETELAKKTRRDYRRRLREEAKQEKDRA